MPTGFFVEVQADYDTVRVAGDPPLPPEAVVGAGAEMDASGLFRVVAERRYLWEVVYTADAYIDLIGTASNHRALGERQRTQLFDLIRARIGDRTVRTTYLATLDVALQRDPPRS